MATIVHFPICIHLEMQIETEINIFTCSAEKPAENRLTVLSVGKDAGELGPPRMAVGLLLGQPWFLLHHLKPHSLWNPGTSSIPRKIMSQPRLSTWMFTQLPSLWCACPNSHWLASALNKADSSFLVPTLCLNTKLFPWAPCPEVSYKTDSVFIFRVWDLPCQAAPRMLYPFSILPVHGPVAGSLHKPQSHSCWGTPCPRPRAQGLQLSQPQESKRKEGLR